MPEPHQRNAFRLGDVVSGEPQLYCGYVARPFMPRTLALAIWLCRRVVTAAQNLFSHASAQRSATIATLPSKPAVPARHHAADGERRAA